MKEAVRRVCRSIVTSFLKICEGIYEWIDAKKSRKKIYRKITRMIAFLFLCLYVVLAVKVLWLSLQTRSLYPQAFEPIPLSFAAAFFIGLSKLFGPDDRREPPDDPIYPWPQFPEDNRPELILMFDCTLDGRRVVDSCERFEQPISSASTEEYCLTATDLLSELPESCNAAASLEPHGPL